MVRRILKNIEHMDNRIIKIINMGLIISLLLGLVGIALIYTYNTYSVIYDFYKAGFILIKTSIAFSAQFVACGLAFNKIIRE